MRLVSSKSLQFQMAEMKEGETILFVTPSKSIVFECKTVKEHEPKIEWKGASHIFYDEMPDFELIDRISDPIPALMKRLDGGIFIDANPASTILKEAAKAFENIPAPFEVPTKFKEKNRGPQHRRSFPVPK